RLRRGASGRLGAKRRVARAVFQESIYLGVGDDDVGIDRALPQPGHADVGAERLAVFIPADAGFFDLAAHLLNRHAIALCDGLDGLVDLLVVDTDAQAIGLLRLQAVHDEALQHLPAQNVLRRHLDAAPR